GLHAEFQCVLVAGARSALPDIPLSVPPRAALHALIGPRRGPQEKPFVVLRDQHHVSGSRRFGRAQPLVGIELGGMEDLGTGGSLPPFPRQKRGGAGKKKKTKNKGLSFHPLPGGG